MESRDDKYNCLVVNIYCQHILQQYLPDRSDFNYSSRDTTTRHLYARLLN